MGTIDPPGAASAAVQHCITATTVVTALLLLATRGRSGPEHEPTEVHDPPALSPPSPVDATASALLEGAKR